MKKLNYELPTMILYKTLTEILTVAAVTKTIL